MLSKVFFWGELNYLDNFKILLPSCISTCCNQGLNHHWFLGSLHLSITQTLQGIWIPHPSILLSTFFSRTCLQSAFPSWGLFLLLHRFSLNFKYCLTRTTRFNVHLRSHTPTSVLDQGLTMPFRTSYILRHPHHPQHVPAIIRPESESYPLLSSVMISSLGGRTSVFSSLWN